MQEAHTHLVEYQKEYGHTVGSLLFDSDHASSALQAADVVSWAVRRGVENLKNEFFPLADLLDAKMHLEFHYDETAMNAVAEHLRRRSEDLTRV